MVQFVNIYTGRVYDGSKPYIHWFEGQQSTGVTYSLPVLFIYNKKSAKVKINKGAFNFIYNPDASKDYKDQITNEISITPSFYHEGKYIYLFYITGFTESPGEYIDSFFIDDEEFSVGMDCYNEDETLYINASNFGIEFPETIQKALYPYNIHSNDKDNILLNRKFKELLTNYWDLVANKGSYKSLVNSLKWFEWGDLVSLKEIWSHEKGGKLFYNELDICDILKPRFNDVVECFTKTTYVSLYYALQYISEDSYDSEKNPILYEVASKWSIDDIALKMCMLGNFFETYFLPIHLNILHSTIESIIFANNIKIITGTISDIRAYIFNSSHVNIIVNDNKPIYISNIRSGVDSATMFVNKEFQKVDDKEIYPEPVGIKPYNEVATYAEDDQDAQLYFSQCYSGPGAIVPIKCIINDVDDFIKCSTITVYDGEKKTMVKDYTVITSEDNKLIIDFNLLLKDLTPKTFELFFETGGGQTYYAKQTIQVEYSEQASIKFYSIVNSPVTDLVNKPFNSLTKDSDKFSYILNTNEKIYNQVVACRYSDHDALDFAEEDFSEINYKVFKADLDSTNYILVLYSNSEITKHPQLIIEGIKTRVETLTPVYRDVCRFTQNTVGLQYNVNTYILSSKNRLFPREKVTGVRIFKRTGRVTGVFSYNTPFSQFYLNRTISCEEDSNLISDIENNIVNGVNVGLSYNINTLREHPEYIHKYKTHIYTSKEYTNTKVGIDDEIFKNFYISNINNIIKNSLVYIPSLHTLIELDIKGDTLEDYVISDKNICVKPFLGEQPLDFAKTLEWVFENQTNGKTYTLKHAANPFITFSDGPLEPGFYNITLKYSLCDDRDITIKSPSPFLIKKSTTLPSN